MFAATRFKRVDAGVHVWVCNSWPVRFGVDVAAAALVLPAVASARSRPAQGAVEQGTGDVGAGWAREGG